MKLFLARRLVASIFLALQCQGCLYGRLFYFNSPSLAAPGYFDSRIVRASRTPLPLPKSAHEATLRLTTTEHARYGSFDDLLEAQGTRAFVVIHDDVIVYERYFHGVSVRLGAHHGWLGQAG